MDVDREQLQKLREQIGRKAHLTSMLDNLYVQEKEQKEKVEELRQEKEDEQKDVDRLEDRGLTALFYSLIGKIDEKMTKEQKEALRILADAGMIEIHLGDIHGKY